MPRNEYIDDSRTDETVQTFIGNAIKWLGQNPEGFQIASAEKQPIGKYTEQLKIVGPKDLASQKDVKVYYQNAHSDVDEEGVKSILEFVENGGGLLTLGQAWQWIKVEEKSILSYPGNR